MCQYLPTGTFDQSEVFERNKDNIKKSNSNTKDDHEYFIECDIENPQIFLEKTKHFHFCREKTAIKIKNYSEDSMEIKRSKYKFFENLIMDQTKERKKIHFRIFNVIIKNMESKLQKYLLFINLDNHCGQQKRKIRTQIKELKQKKLLLISLLHKIMLNSLYGKLIENKRKCISVDLIKKRIHEK